MPRRYPKELRRQVVELARAGTKVPQLSTTFGMSEATISNWLRQKPIDRREIPGMSTDMALDLAAAKRRNRQLEAELAISRKVNEVGADQGVNRSGSTYATSTSTGCGYEPPPATLDAMSAQSRRPKRSPRHSSSTARTSPAWAPPAGDLTP